MTAVPTLHSDGSWSGVVEAISAPRSPWPTITLTLPAAIGAEALAGRLFMARCWDDPTAPGGVYLRRPLFLVQSRSVADGALTRCEFLLPGRDDPGATWLCRLPAGAAVHLLGPFGNGFALHTHSRALLLVADHKRVPLLLPLSDQILDRGGQVTLLLREPERQAASDNQALRSALAGRLPLAVEIQPVGSDEEWLTALKRLLPWADQVCAGLPSSLFVELAGLARQTRFRLDEGFGQMFVEADYACGWGGCLACVVPLGKGGHTRACVHGPVMDLRKLGG